MAKKRERDLVTVFVDIVFLTDEKSPSALAAFKALKMHFWYSEYQMYWKKSPSFSASLPQELILRKKNIREDQNKVWLYLAFCQTSSTPLGSCRILPYDHFRFYLYHLEVKKTTGEGAGKKALNRCSWRTSSTFCRNLAGILQ